MSKLELLIRKNKGKREQNEYCEGLNSILGTSLTPADFVELEKSDILVKDYYNSLKLKPKVFARRYETQQLSDLTNDIIRESSTLQEDNVYIITRYTENCGLVIVPLDKAIRFYDMLIKFDGDSLRLLSTTRDSGVFLDLFEEYNDGILGNYYELKVWF